MNAGDKERLIEPASGWSGFDLPELWDYRDLLLFLVWRDLKVRYRQTLLGFAWAVLVPLTQMAVFAYIFGRVAQIGTDGIPAPAFYYAALLPWNYFSNATAQASASLVSHAPFLTRIYVPRLIIPLAPCIAGLVDFGIAMTILAGLAGWYRIAPTPALLALPLLLAIAVLTATGLGYLLSSLNVRYRDVRHAVPFLLQVWMYLTVVLPVSALPASGPARHLYGLNPMAGVVEGFRWCLFYDQMNPASRWVAVASLTLPSFVPLVAVGFPVAVVMLVVGLWAFNKMDRAFADTV